MKTSLIMKLKEYSLAVISVIIFLIFFNVMVSYAWRFYSMNRVNPLTQHPVRVALSDLDDHELDLLFAETWDPGWQYQSWVGFAEIPRTGSYVTVYEGGFRRTEGSSNLISSSENAKDKLFFFGGSTTFGYNVADGHTAPSYFQRLLPQYDVFNFGRGYYYSKQENILLSDLLQKGHRPAVAIFIDGLNERCDDHPYQNEVAHFFSLAQDHRGEKAADWIITALSQLPMAKLIGKMTSRSTENNPYDMNGGASTVERMLELRLKVRKSICDAFDVKCLSFLQPIAGVHGTHESYESLSQHDRDALLNRYLRLSSIRDSTWFDISDSLDGISNHAYVDNVHYSPEANERIARAVAQVLSGQVEGQVHWLARGLVELRER